MPKTRRTTRAARKPLSRSKRIGFSIAMALVPVLLLLLLELCARAFGHGGYPPIILDIGRDGQTHWYSTNRAGTNTFFGAGHTLKGGMRDVCFTTPKPPGTIRIALLGGSAMQGFPQPLPLTNGSFLEAMLEDVWGGTQDVEVLNFGATAVASFPVMHILDAVLEHEPDLLLLMAGNNEFYGAYGVLSLPSAARSPAAMKTLRWLRGTGLAQWLTSILHRDSPSSGTLMAQMAKGRPVAPSDPARAAAARSLRAHLTAMVRHCHDAGVPIVVCTVPTNERGLAPIGREIEPPTDASTQLRTRLTAAEAELSSDPARARDDARAALQIQDTNARAHFTLARALADLGIHDEALDEWITARDLDTAPWRATSATRDAVDAAVAEGGLLCDIVAAFRTSSPGGAIGWELMDDHVHMSLRGQALFAETLLRAITAVPGFPPIDPERIEALPSWESYAERLGHSPYTDYVAATRVRSIFGIPFMRNTNEGAARRADERCDDLLAAMSDVDRAAVERWRDPALHGSTDRPLSFVVGLYRMSEGDYGSAEALFRTARAAVPTVSLWRVELDWHILSCRRHLQEHPTEDDRQLCLDAIATGELLERFGNTGNVTLARNLGLAYNLIGNHTAAIRCLESAVRSVEVGERGGWEVVAALADSYVQVGQVDSARRLLRMAAQEPQMRDAAGRMLRALDAP